MKILVTGGAGFIGSHLMRTLEAAGHEAIALDNLSTGLRENLLPHMKLIVMDTHDKAVEDVFKKEHFDAVVHLAAQTLVSDSMTDPEHDMHENIAGTVRILECCRKYSVKRIVFSSSAATYGDVADSALPISETLPQQPLSFYGLTKKTAENYLELYRLAYGIDYVILRFANVYGERQGDGGEGGVISIFAKRIAEADLQISRMSLASSAQELEDLRAKELEYNAYRKDYERLQARLAILQDKIPSTANELNHFLDSVNQRARSSRITNWTLFKQEGTIPDGGDGGHGGKTRRKY